MTIAPIVFADNHTSRDLSKDETDELSRYAGIGLKELCSRNQNLLLFPGCFGDNGDDIDAPLCSITGGKLWTGNIVGFWGTGNVNVRVHSRFDTDERQYLFNYMLQRISGVNVLDLKTLPGPESIWDFLIYLFPMALKRAMRQGIYRAYRVFEYDDAKVKGVVNVSRFIRRDIPFAGRISYTTREHTADNSVIQLIRHTIEYIRHKAPALLNVDTEMRNAVDCIVQLTSDYSERNRTRVMFANLRPVRHPFYSAYSGLQKLCLRILRGERLSFGTGDGEISGIVFDAAWLWEEYLNSVFVADGRWVDLVHPQNKKGKNGVCFYKPDDEHPGYRAVHYPDFYSSARRIVLDAKYKSDSRIGGDDLMQIVSYMHILGFHIGVFIKPDPLETCYRKDGTLDTIVHETVGVVKLKIPAVDKVETFNDFVGKMHVQESKFLEECHRPIAERAQRFHELNDNTIRKVGDVI